jgi:sulfane dehydrogenase subunit SoxC
MNKKTKFTTEKRPGNISRRTLLGGMLAAVVLPVEELFALETDLAIPDDPTKVPGPGPSPLGKRSGFENPVRKPSDISSRTPLQDLHSTITPADLHFERHHAGIPTIDPGKHELLIHGLVEQPMKFTLADWSVFHRLPAPASLSALVILEQEKQK